MKASDIIAACRREGRPALTEYEAGLVFRGWGIPVVEGLLIKGDHLGRPEEPAFDWPIVAKLMSPQILHKTDAGCVRLDIGTAEELQTACQEMHESARHFRPGAAVQGFLIQPMVRGGTEVIVGGLQDPHFGPVIMCGFGGVYTEVLKDVSFRMAPVAPDEARRMVEELRGFPILKGTRGRKPADLEAFANVVSGLSRLLADMPEIREIDCNPLLVFEEGRGCLALDAVITLSQL